MVSFRNAITPSELADFLIQKFHDFATPVHRAEELIAESALRLMREEKSRLENVLRYFQSITHNRILRNKHLLDTSCQTLQQETKFLLKTEREKLSNYLAELKVAPTSLIQHQHSLIKEKQNDLRRWSTLFTKAQEQALLGFEKNVAFLDPINVLRRGFTITLHTNGKAVKESKNLRVGESITTIFADGSVVSRVETAKSDNNE